MKLIDSISRQLTEIVPNTKGEFTLYSCGPTVYDHAHIGNLRTFIQDDLLRRALVAEHPDKLHAIMNITDIDDKTIARAREENPDQPLPTALTASTRHYETLFLGDLNLVGIDLDLVTLVRATEEIKPMQSLIRDIFANGLAYVSEGSVYFSVGKYVETGERYGLLTNVEYSPQARIDSDEYDKHEARDFVLWKAAKPEEPSWDLELGGELLPGRPGWHIECSAMSGALGLPISLHSGGVDLKFPHHENELAQTQGGEGQLLARAFVHWNHLLVDGRKMSKSAGNFYRLQDVIDRGYSPLAFRLLVLQSRYESELNFTWAVLDSAQQTLLGLYAGADRQFQTTTEQSEPKITLPTQSIQDALGDNLDTPQALQLLIKGLGEIEQDSKTWGMLPHYLKDVDQLLGLGLSERVDITTEQKQLIAEREKARKSGDFTKSDEIRQKLLDVNIAIDDTQNGPLWRRTTI